MVPTKTKPPPEPGHADTLKPDVEEAADRAARLERQTAELGKEVHASDLRDVPGQVGSQQDMLSSGDVNAGEKIYSSKASVSSEPTSDADLDYWEPKPPKVLMEDPNATPWELRAQIQLYATTE